MDEQQIIYAAVAYVRELFAGDSGGHGVDHTLRVWGNARQLAEGEPTADRFVVELAALLHDADDHKLFHTQDNANARAFMAREGVDADIAERVVEAVNSVSFSQNRGRRPTTIEGMIVQDADRLDAIGAIGIARACAYGGQHGRGLDDTVAHFHEKLLLLAGEMNTPAGRELAQRRHAFLLAFLDELDSEGALTQSPRT